jgi:hypothetical protein
LVIIGLWWQQLTNCFFVLFFSVLVPTPFHSAALLIGKQIGFFVSTVRTAVVYLQFCGKVRDVNAASIVIG